MNRSWAARALLVLALPALLVPALAGPASAGGAITKDSLPAVAQVAEVYPHLAGGQREISRSKRLDAPGRTCSDDKRYPAASGFEATYFPASFENATFGAAEPIVMVTSLRLRSTKQARAAVQAFARFASKCRKVRDKEDGTVATVSKVRVGKLGDQRAGMTMRTRQGGITANGQYIVVRTKSVVTTVVTASMSGTPSAKQAVRLAGVAVQQAG